MLNMSFVPDKSGTQLHKCLLISEEESLSKVKTTWLESAHCNKNKRKRFFYLDLFHRRTTSSILMVMPSDGLKDWKMIFNQHDIDMNINMNVINKHKYDKNINMIINMNDMNTACTPIEQNQNPASCCCCACRSCHTRPLRRLWSYEANSLLYKAAAKAVSK